MVRIGIVGIGFMGMTHYYAIQDVYGAEVRAICTRDQNKLDGDWTGIQGNFGPAGDIEDVSHLHRYDRIDALINDPEIDLVDICLPAHLHKETSIAALKAGKHVLVEKPISVSLEDADEMVQTAKESGRHFMVAHVLPFFAEFAYLKRSVESGVHGQLLGGHFKRVTSKTKTRYDLTALDMHGGPGIDLHIHDTHFIQLLCGMPRAVFSQGISLDDDFVESVTTQYIFDLDDFSISCSSGAMSQHGRPFSHGFEVYLEQATLIHDFSTLGGKAFTSMPLTLLNKKGEVHQVDLGATNPTDAFTNEIQYAVDAIIHTHEPVTLSGIGARNALLLCYKEAESIKQGNIVTVA